MSEERKSVGRLLQNASTYGDPEAAAPGAGWREAVLMNVAEDLGTATRPAAVEAEVGPLRARHLLMMAPAGLALFGLGWWVGRGGVSADEIAAVPTAAWMASAAVIAAGSLVWYGMSALRFGRGRSRIG